jgi:hypothetical protein
MEQTNSVEAISELEVASTVFTIYRHIHNESGRSYIGLTKNKWQHRWSQHISKSAHVKNPHNHFYNAIRKYGSQAFSHEILQVCLTIEEANIAEQFWIYTYDTRNPLRGFNLALGGSHTPHPVKNPWDRPEYRAKATVAAKERWQDPVYRAKSLAASKAGLNTPESKIKRSASAKISMNSTKTIEKRKIMRSDPSYGIKISKTLKESLSSPYIRARMSESASTAWAKPDIRKKILLSIIDAAARPEIKQKLSAASKIMWSRPDYIEKQKTKIISEETRAKISAASTGKRHTPESIVKQRQLYLIRSSTCKFCGRPIEGKRTCINGHVACFKCSYYSTLQL